MRKTAALWLVAVGLSLCIPGACAEIALVQDGTSGHEIVLGPEPGRVAQFAAQELQRFVEQSTGVRLAIVAEPSPDRGHIHLGANPVSAAAGITPDDLRPEGFHLNTAGQDIHIVGADTDGDPTKINTNFPVQCGTLSGVYELLERCIGVVFAWHDELGTVVPQREQIIVPELDETQAPGWSYRRLSYSPEGQTGALFGRRLRLGAQLSIRHSHAWFQILSVEKYAEEHPEYFALVGGERRARHYSGHHGGQVCTSNPEVIEVFANAAIEYFDKYPQFDMFSVSPNDGGGFCQCDSCRALDGGDFREDEPDQPVLTDRLLAFYNAIAERLVQRHPDKLLGAYIYSYYKDPPKREKPHPNLYLVNATNSAHSHGVGWPLEHEKEKQWTAMTKRFAKYDIYYYGLTSLDLIAPVTTHIAEKIPAEQEVGIVGGYLYIGQSYEQLGAGHYVLARLMWDKDADARELEDRYYNGLYGPAGTDVKSYYHLLEDRLRKMYLEDVDVDEPAVERWVKLRSSGGTAGRLLAAYWPVLDEASGIIAQAKARQLSDLEQQRLDRLIAQHDLMVATVRGMIAAGRLEAQAHFSPDDVTMLKQAVETREAAKARIREYAPTLAQYIEESDKDSTAPVTPHGAFFQLTQAQKPLELSAVRAGQAPQIDGLDTDAAWSAGPVHYFLLSKSAVPPSLGARARLAFDDEKLYILVDGREEDTGKLIAKPTDPDDTAVFDGDAVEVFISPPNTEAYYQIALGAGGGVYDAALPTGDPAESEREWSANARTGVSISETGWSAEFALPFASFGASPADGEWRVNVCRTRRGNPQPDEYTAIAPTFSGYHTPQRFAPLRFVDKWDQAGFTDGTFDNVPVADAEKRLRVFAGDGAMVELVSDRAYAGQQSLHVVVPEKGLASITLDAVTAEKTGYRALVTHRNSGVTLNPAVRDQAPITRVIFRGKGAKAVTDTKGYSWDGAAALERPDEWRVMPHVFTTPENTRHISFTIFFHHPGEYWVDEVRLEEL